MFIMLYEIIPTHKERVMISSICAMEIQRFVINGGIIRNIERDKREKDL